VSERGQGALIERMVRQHPGHALLAALGLLLIGMLVWSLAAVPEAHDWSTRHTVAERCIEHGGTAGYRAEPLARVLAQPIEAVGSV